MEDLYKNVAALVHKQKHLDAAKLINEACELRLKLEDRPKDYLPVLQHWLHFLLNSGKPHEAARLLWTPNQFSFEPQFTRDLWKFFDEVNMGIIMGAGSCSKSFGMGVRLFLEWLRDPEYTGIKVVGPSEDHLETNLFSHLVGLHQRASLPMPGYVGELFIGTDRRNQTAAIKGVTIPIGRVKKAARLQGSKRVPRQHPHPEFGALTRMFIFLDEFENIPSGIWSDIDNILSNVNEEGPEGFKIFGAYNPTDQTAEVGKRAEPPFGWADFDVDKHYRWKSTRGWDVIRLDGEKSENVVQGRVIFPGLQTRAGLEAMAKNAGGRNAPGYFSMGRGAYPPSGVELTVFPPGMIPKMRGEFIWYDKPQPVGSVDMALEGGAAAVYTLGKFGKATGFKRPPSLNFPNGEVVMFKDSMGQVVPQWALQADQQFTLPKGNTVAMKDQIIETNKKAGVRPEYFAIDRTGNGAGTADLIKDEWGQSIHDVNFSEGASTDKIMIEDTKTCDKAFERMNSELWFAIRAWSEFQYFLLHPQMDLGKLTQQMTQRKYRMVGGKSRVEPKKDYIGRGFSSPDEADSLTLLVHAARKGSKVVLSMKKADSVDPYEQDDELWWNEMNFKGGAFIDCTNQTDYLREG